MLLGCTPLIPSADLERSLHFREDGLGFTMDRAMRRDGRLIGCLIGCMVHMDRVLRHRR